MYRIAPGIKQNPERRWVLCERVVFACGACNILAYAFLERYQHAGFVPIWQKPADGHTGNHIFVARATAVSARRASACRALPWPLSGT